MYNRLPVVIQTQKNQCGVACLLMILRYAGVKLSINTISKNFDYEYAGVTAQELIDVATIYGSEAKLVKFKPKDISELSLPCILHWGHNHFVVLAAVKNNYYVIHDPERGRIKLSAAEIRKKITCFAIEFSYPKKISKVVFHKSDISFKSIISGSNSLKNSLIKVGLVTVFVQILTVFSSIAMQVYIDKQIKADEINLISNSILTGIISLLFASIIVIFCREKMMLDFSNQVSMQLGVNTFDKLFRKPLEYFKGVNASEHISKFMSIEPIRQFLTQTSVKLIVDGCTAFLCVTAMFFYEPVLALVSVIFVTVYIGWKKITYGFISDLNATKVALSIKSNSILSQNVETLLTQKIYGVEKVKEQEWIDNFNHLMRSIKSSGQWAMNNKVVFQALFGSETIITIILGLHFYSQGHLSIGSLFAYTALKVQFSSAAINLIDEFFLFRLLDPHLWNISDLISSKSTQVQSDNHVPSLGCKKWYSCTLSENKVNSNCSSEQPVLELVDCGLTYEDGTSIFSELNIKIFKNDIVAIAGESGCGKSSLLNCLVGAQRLTNGYVFFRNASLSTPEQCSKKIGAVLQGDKLLSGTILENITGFAKEPDFVRAEKSLILAGIASEIEKFPYGVHSIVGYQNQKLSKGQEIRLLIARAIYINPEIFIFDEPISNLGAEKSKEIEENLLSLNIPIIYVSHQNFLSDKKTKEIKFLSNKELL